MHTLNRRIICQKGQNDLQKLDEEIFYRRVKLFGQQTKILVGILFKVTRYHVSLTRLPKLQGVMTFAGMRGKRALSKFAGDIVKYELFVKALR